MQRRSFLQLLGLTAYDDRPRSCKHYKTHECYACGLSRLSKEYYEDVNTIRINHA